MAKLDKTEKAFRKAWKQQNPNAIIVSRHETLTAIFVPTCRGMGALAWSICGPKDKFNRKRGEYEAMARFDTGETLPCKMPGDMVEAEEMLAAISAFLMN